MSAIRNSAQVNVKSKEYIKNYERIFKKKKKKPTKKRQVTIHI